MTDGVLGRLNIVVDGATERLPPLARGAVGGLAAEDVVQDTRHSESWNSFIT